jgi:hypothetical protein
VPTLVVFVNVTVRISVVVLKRKSTEPVTAFPPGVVPLVLKNRSTFARIGIIERDPRAMTARVRKMLMLRI